MELRIYVVEPETVRRRLVCDCAEQTQGLSVLGAAPSFRVEPAGLEADVDFFLVNACLLQSEREAMQAAARRYAGSYFVLFSTHPDIEALIESTQLPVRGFLSFNHLSGDEFARSLLTIAHGGAVIEPISAQLILDYLGSLNRPRIMPINVFDLTVREQEVLEWVRRGLSNKEIAHGLEISLGTVRAHLRSVFRKLDVTSRAGAVASYLAPAPVPLQAPRRLAG